MTFGLTYYAEPEYLPEEDFVSGKAYEFYMRLALWELFTQEVELRSLYTQGLAPKFADTTLEHHHFDGRFDAVAFSFKIKQLGVTPFLATSRFTREDRLVTLAVTSGTLTFTPEAERR